MTLRVCFIGRHAVTLDEFLSGLLLYRPPRRFNYNCWGRCQRSSMKSRTVGATIPEIFYGKSRVLIYYNKRTMKIAL